MCGIAGIFDKEGSPVDPLDVRRMCDRIFHRGPDQDGYFVHDEIGIGMRRLKIIDLETGEQPILNEDETIAVVFNGEVYNFVELRRDLEKRHHFKTQSDTECIVHAYEEYGLDFIHHLRGMFAICIWDSRVRRLILARDRLGKKPLYFSNGSSRLLFASELKSLLEVLDGTPPRQFGGGELLFLSGLHPGSPLDLRGYFQAVSRGDDGH